ncbi:MAG TPA: hypothetical protein PK325_04535 [Cyclobacteriaceae bacterium]|nr:hypothetical protein [Cyclobacteriaceae bacterium]HMV11145.1 hypothetical protein [Cyclobacteriaceae bacterium]HMV90876.1 hypothetical protein [Cyclobacteriaceae bacterium]HMX01744.1 hypothetical protein [Cyclobacteriaceae bacterium]HMX51421.1 hypothetical protein [Cyclobacteriaceae bacterium]
MTRLTIFLVLITNLSFGQIDQDYHLYSQVLNDYIKQRGNDDATTIEVVIITKYAPGENEVSAYGEDFLNSDETTINMVLHYDTVKIKLFKDYRVKNALRQLETEFFETPSLDKAKFTLTSEVSAIANKEFKSYFRRRIDRGWKKFYKSHPGALGVFEFSKVVYADTYACFYVGRYSNRLSGSGDIVIAEQLNGEWSIVTSVNSWMN